MYLLISLLPALLLVCLAGEFLRKKAVCWYATAIVLSAGLAAGYYTGDFKSFPGWLRDWVWPLLERGAFSSSLFILVMYGGALPNSSRLRKKILPVRGELSIVASILTLGHNISYGGSYYRLLFTRPGSLRLNQLAAAVCSVLMLAIMLPLFVTSFKAVRRKMAGRSWKRLQRAAYGFYALMYIHVLLLMLPAAQAGRGRYLLSVIVYSAVFLTYAALRITKALRRRPAGLRRLSALLCAAAFLVVCGVAALPALSRSLPAKAEADAAEEAEAVSDQAVSAEQESTDPVSAAPRAETAGSTAPAELSYKDGTYSGSGEGYNGEVTVKVTIEDGKIKSIRPVAYSDDEPYWTDSTGLIEEILRQQTAQVDVVSGATSSSHGILEAVSDALSKA